MLRSVSLRCCVVAVGLAVVFAAGCSGRPSRVHPPSINASSAGREAMKQYDLDGDGKVSGAELDKAPSLKFALSRLDTDGDGAVTADDVTARVGAWQESKVGRMSVVLTILSNGKPLEGATVTLDPEPFLGSDVKPATGVTDSSGLVMPSIETGPDDPPGVAPGFYLVRVTKEGMNIPPMYNTETVLGVELAQDVIELEEGITFDLR
ncbi:MAG: EF-hand domain-containing protein [Thermoguttaceae bacterium]|nr:EF-hand domain-containing protein [Thermoguttaceae bacterium]